MPLNVLKASQTISWATPGDISPGTPLGPAQLDAVVTVPGPSPAGDVSYMPPAGTILPVGNGQTLTVNVAATPDYNAAVSSVSINVVVTPDLRVTAVTLPTTNGLQSGQPASFSYTVTNTGSAPTGVSAWVDSVFLSQDTTLGDNDDIAIGQFTHNGVLNPGDSYTVTQTVTLPDGISGDFHLIINTDSTNFVHESADIMDKVTVSASTFHVALAPYADLRVEGLSVSGPDPNGTFSVAWNTANRGTGVAAGAWQELVAVTNLTTGTLVFDEEYEVEGPLAVAATTPHSVSFSNLPLGIYEVVVTTDVTNQIYEFDALGHEDAEQNNTAQSNFDVTRDLQVANLTVTPSSGIQSGTPLTIEWSDVNTGNTATQSSFNDSVSIENTTTGQTLPLVTIPYDAVVRGDLGAGQSAAQQYAFTLADGEAGAGQFLITVTTNAGSQIQEFAPNGNAQANNTATAAFTSTLAPYPDLVVNNIVGPTQAISGSAISVGWTVANQGDKTTDQSWVDSVYLANAQTPGTNVLIGTFDNPVSLATGQSYTQNISFTLPIEISGTFEIVVVANSDNAFYELNTANDRGSSAPFPVQLAPYADLAVSNVTAPAQTIGDPAYPVISWTVTNVGTGAGQTSTWTDAIIASPSDAYNDPDAVTLAEYTHTGGLAVGASYTQTQTVQMPAGFTGRYYLFVETDAGNVVFEDGSKANNVGEAPNHFDVMPIPYADLVVSSIADPQNAGSGLPVNVTWTVTNQGIGLTSVPSWSDDLALASDPAGKNIIEDYGLFNHLGPVGPGGNYVRTAQVVLPEGLSGTYYFVVTAAAQDPPFEFIYGNGTDNVTVSAPFTINFTPPPDLAVTNVNAPTTGEEGSTIQVGWTVQNVGPGPAIGSWQDEVVIQQAGQPSSQFLVLGTFTNFSAVDPGNQYSRTEAVNLPLHISGLYNVEVITNYDGELFENGATANNTGIAPQPITVTVTPRPDLQVASIEAPQAVNAGGTFSVTYTVINQGSAPTTSNWDDKIYLSLTPYVADDSILIQDLPNQSALGPGDEYQATTVPVTVPDRYAGQVYVIVDIDANHVIDQWPNGTHDLEYQPIYVNPIPLPDLVLSNVVVPTQVIAGSTFNVSYTVTDLGSGPTLEDNWTDAVWLTRDKTRPIPASGDILLTQIAHSGGLALDAGYDQTLSITLPINLAPGTYYITPWTDMYSVVLQNTLAVNVNPDDPNNFQSDNYKAAQIDVLAPLPDLVISSVTAPTQAKGGDDITVDWTVENTGNGPAQPTGWIDTVYLTNDPTDPLDQNAITMTLGSVTQNAVLNVGASYNASLNVELSPSAAGQYFVVYTDAPQPGIQTPYNVVEEVSETNNLMAVADNCHAGAGRSGRHQCLDSHGELLGREHDVHLHGRE